MAIIKQSYATTSFITNRIDALQKQNDAQKQYIDKLELRIKQLERTLRGIRRVR